MGRSRRDGRTVSMELKYETTKPLDKSEGHILQTVEREMKDPLLTSRWVTCVQALQENGESQGLEHHVQRN